jgi:cephalosporin hydroxylase
MFKFKETYNDNDDDKSNRSKLYHSTIISDDIKISGDTLYDGDIMYNIDRIIESYKKIIVIKNSDHSIDPYDYF